MLFLLLSILGFITFLLLTLFFTLKSVSSGSIISSIFNNKFIFIIIYGVFTFLMVITVALTYDLHDNIFPVWLIIFSLTFMFSIILIVMVYFALKLSSSSKLKIYQAPGSTSKDISTLIVLEDIIQVEGGVEGEVLENVKFFPGTKIVKSFDYGDYEEDSHPRKIFIEGTKVHYFRDNINYLKGNLVPSRDPRYDVEVSMMGFDNTKEMYDMAEKLDYYKSKYYSIKDQVTDLVDAFRHMGANQKDLSDSMSAGTKQLLERVNVQMRGQTEWEQKSRLETMGLTRKEMKKYKDADRQLRDLKQKGSEQ